MSRGLVSVLCAVDCEGYGTVDYSGVDRVTAPYTEKNHFILLFPLLCSECSINWGLASVLYTQCSCREREPLSIYYSAALHDPPFSI